MTPNPFLILDPCHLRLPPTMNLLFLSETFPDAASPAKGTYNDALCLALSRQNTVRVIAPRQWPEVLKRRLSKQATTIPAHLEQAGIEVAYPTYWYTPRFGETFYGRWMSRSVRRDVDRFQKAAPIDAVLSYWAHPDGEAALKAARRCGVPSAVIVGGSDVLLLPKRKGRGACVRRVLQESSAVITVSEGLRSAVIELGVDPSRVHTICQGVDRDRFHPGDQDAARRRIGLGASGAKTLLWVGRMVDVKRLDLLLDACRLLWKSGMRISLHLVGDGPLRPTLERQAVEAGLEECVHFEGAVGHEMLADWYRAADLAVLSSSSEGLPNVLREAVACGTPFVSTDVGSIREIARPEFSRLVPAGSVGGLATAIREALHPSYKEAARAYQPRSWADCADDVQRLLERLRSNGPGPGAQSLGPASKVQLVTSQK